MPLTIGITCRVEESEGLERDRKGHEERERKRFRRTPSEGERRRKETLKDRDAEGDVEASLSSVGVLLGTIMQKSNSELIMNS